MQVGEKGGPDKNVVRNNSMEALAILEGQRRPVHSRDCTGLHADEFKKLATMNIKPLHAPCSLQLSRNDHMRGWRYLRQTLFERLSGETATKLVPWDDQQHAYLLTLEEDDKFWVVRRILKLDTCSPPKLRDLMEQVKQGGWQDVIWVMYGDETPPFRLDKEVKATVMRWK